MGSIGKNSLTLAVFPPHRLPKDGPRAWNTSLPRDQESLQSLLSLLPCGGASFPVMFMHMHHKAPEQTHCCVFLLHAAAWRGMHSPSAARMDQWGQMSLEKLSSTVSSLIVSPVLDCMVFPDSNSNIGCTEMFELLLLIKQATDAIWLTD